MPTTPGDPAALILDALVAPCPTCRTRYVARLADGLPAGDCADCTDGTPWADQLDPTSVAGRIVTIGIARLARPLFGDAELAQPF